MTTYEPADVADAIIAEARNCRIDKAIITAALQKMGVHLVDPTSVVILDPNNPDDQERVVKWALAEANLVWSHLDARDAIRSLLPIPTPPLPEPNGLGAVVRGVILLGEGLPSDEVKWVRAVEDGGPAKWALSMPGLRSGYERWWLWSAMHVTEVVSHGVGCTCGGPGCPALTVKVCGICSQEGHTSDGHEPRPGCPGGSDA